MISRNPSITAIKFRIELFGKISLRDFVAIVFLCFAGVVNRYTDQHVKNEFLSKHMRHQGKKRYVLYITTPISTYRTRCQSKHMQLHVFRLTTRSIWADLRCDIQHVPFFSLVLHVLSMTTRSICVDLCCKRQHVLV